MEERMEESNSHRRWMRSRSRSGSVCVSVWECVCVRVSECVCVLYWGEADLECARM